MGPRAQRGVLPWRVQWGRILRRTARVEGRFTNSEVEGRNKSELRSTLSQKSIPDELQSSRKSRNKLSTFPSLMVRHRSRIGHRSSNVATHTHAHTPNESSKIRIPLAWFRRSPEQSGSQRPRGHKHAMGHDSAPI